MKQENDNFILQYIHSKNHFSKILPLFVPAKNIFKIIKFKSSLHGHRGVQSRQHSNFNTKIHVSNIVLFHRLCRNHHFILYFNVR